MLCPGFEFFKVVADVIVFFFFTPIQSELSLWPLVTTCMRCRQFDRFLFINFSLYVPLQASWTMFTSRVQTTNYNPNQINNIHGCKQQVATQFWSFGRSKQIYTWHITLILYKQDKKHLLVICFPVSHLHCVHFAKVSVTQKPPQRTIKQKDVRMGELITEIMVCNAWWVNLT